MKVSAIVPVYNEERTVGKVIEALVKSKIVDEVIAVNDGSTDKSPRILRDLRGEIRLIDSKKNKGKGWALAEGIKNAKGEIVVFLDADITNLAEKHIAMLTTPLETKGVKGVIGQRRSNDLLPPIAVAICGDRAYYRKDLLPHLKTMKQTRFGVEMFLNDLYKNKIVKVVRLRGMRALTKPQKHGKVAIKEMVDEAIEIVKEVTRQKKLKGADKKIIKLLREATSLEEFEERISKISDKTLKVVLTKYIVEYLKKIKKLWQGW